jgi:hypothetical protein
LVFYLSYVLTNNTTTIIIKNDLYETVTNLLVLILSALIFQFISRIENEYIPSYKKYLAYIEPHTIWHCLTGLLQIIIVDSYIDILVSMNITTITTYLPTDYNSISILILFSGCIYFISCIISLHQFYLILHDFLIKNNYT